MKQVIPGTTPDYQERRVVERPDGFYWEDIRTGEVFGPFATLLDATNDMEFSAEAESGPGETLHEAKEEIGIADWIDPETGEPAEEQKPHIEDH